MRRSIAVLAGVLGAALLLSACDISIGPGGPPTPRQPDITTDATQDPEAVAANLTVPPNSELLIGVSVPPTLSGAALYIELGANLELGVYDANRSLLASSRSGAFFARGNGGLSPAADLQPQSVDTNIQCRGSCVILPAASHSTVYAIVRNRSGSQVTTPLFAYTDVFQDLNEPSNDRIDTAPFIAINVGLGESGAIETIGDRDYWRISTGGTLLFSAANDAVELRAAVFDAAGQQVGQVFFPGSPITMNAGEVLGVWALDDRAAASANSRYDLSLY